MVSISESFLVKVICICLILIALIASNIINPAETISSFHQYFTPEERTENIPAEIPSQLDYLNPPHLSDCYGAKCSAQTKENLEITDSKMIYHPGHTVFVDTRIRQKWFGNNKGHGLVANKDINEGEIIIVEYPILKLNDDIDYKKTRARMHAIHQIEQQQSTYDANFAEVWKAMAMNRDIFNFFAKNIDPADYLAVINLAKFHTNHFRALSDTKPLSVYGLLSKINFGLPQNIAVIVGDEEEDFVCTVFATKSIKKGQELVTDYFFDWFDLDINKMERKDPKYELELIAREEYGKNFGFKQSEYMQLWKLLSSDDTSIEAKSDAAVRELYPSGIVGKEAGWNMQLIETKSHGTDFELANKIGELVASRNLFEIIAGYYDKKCPRWLGKLFCKKAKRWRRDRLIQSH